MNKLPISFFIVVHLAANRKFRGNGLIDAIRPCGLARCGAAICLESGHEQTSQIGVTKSVFDPTGTLVAKLRCYAAATQICFILTGKCLALTRVRMITSFCSCPVHTSAMSVYRRNSRLFQGLPRRPVAWNENCRTALSGEGNVSKFRENWFPKPNRNYLRNRTCHQPRAVTSTSKRGETLGSGVIWLLPWQCVFVLRFRRLPWVPSVALLSPAALGVPV